MQYCEDCIYHLPSSSPEHAKCKVSPQPQPKDNAGDVRVARSISYESEIDYKYCGVLRENDTCDKFTPKGK